MKFRTLDDTALRKEPAGNAAEIAAVPWNRVVRSWDASADREADPPIAADGFVLVKASAGVGWLPQALLSDFPRPEIDKLDFVRACLMAEADNALDSRNAPYFGQADMVVARALLETGIANMAKGSPEPAFFGPLAMSKAEWDLFRHNAGNPGQDLPLNAGEGGFSATGFDDPIEQAWAGMARLTSDARLMAKADAERNNEGFEGQSPALLDLFVAYLLNSCKGAQALAAARRTPQGLPTVEAADHLTGLLGAVEAKRALERYPQVFGSTAAPMTMAMANAAAEALLSELLTKAAGLMVDAVPDLPAPSPEVTAGAADGGTLGRLVAEGESGTAGYGAFNRDRAGDSAGQKIDFNQMTIAQLMALQAKPRGDPERILAFGKYQLIPGTFASAVAKLKLDKAEKVTDALQERLFRQFLVKLKRPAIFGYVVGEPGATLKGAQIALALEFACFARPDTGRSHYDGKAGNKARISAERAAAALIAEREAFAAAVRAGTPTPDAWAKLSGSAPAAPGPGPAAPDAGSQSPGGRSGVDVDRSVAALLANHEKSSKGLCAKYVRIAIEAGDVKLKLKFGRVPSAQRIGVPTSNDSWTDAKYYGVHLPNNAFDEVPAAGYEPRKGDVAVIENYPGGHWAGHICMYSGSQWVCDYAQGSDYYPNARYRTFRPKARFFRP